MKNRKLLSILTALTLSASLAACGSTTPESAGTTVRETVKAPVETAKIETTVETKEAAEIETEAETETSVYTADDFGIATKGYDQKKGKAVYTKTAYDGTTASCFQYEPTFATLSGSWEDTSLDTLDITFINDEKGVNDTIHYLTDTPESLTENTGFTTDGSELWCYSGAGYDDYDLLFMPEWDESSNTMSFLTPDRMTSCYDDVLINGTSILNSMSELEQTLGAPSFAYVSESNIKYVWNYENCIIILTCSCDTRINGGIAKPVSIAITAHYAEIRNDYEIVNDYHKWLDKQSKTVSE